MLKTVMKTLISASFCLSVIAPATAMPVMMQKPAIESAATSDLVQVRSSVGGYDRDEKRGFYRYNNRGYYNGHRGYRHPRAGYRRYNGYWFPPAAFALGAIIGGAMNQNNYRAVRPGYLNPQHVRACYRKYRSYREWDNTYQPYHGPRRECRTRFY